MMVVSFFDGDRKVPMNTGNPPLVTKPFRKRKVPCILTGWNLVTHKYTHIYKYTYSHTQTHTHTHTQKKRLSPSWSIYIRCHVDGYIHCVTRRKSKEGGEMLRHAPWPPSIWAPWSWAVSLWIRECVRVLGLIKFLSLRWYFYPIASHSRNCTDHTAKII